MKNTTIIALAILLLTVPFSCSQSGKEEVKSKIIDVASSVGGGRITDLSEIVSDIKYIPLETSKNSLVGEMVRVNYEKGRIYINDRSDSVKIFDYDGKFLRNFGRRGRGPQEYGFLEIFYVTPQNGNIIICSSVTGKCVFNYDSTGKFIHKFFTAENQKYNTQPPLWLNGNSYVSAVQFYTDKPEFSAVVYDSLGKVKYFFPIPKLPPYKIFKGQSIMAKRSPDGKTTLVYEESNIKLNPDIPYLYRYGDKIRLVYDSNDTIISIGNNLQVDSPYVFNFGKYRDYSMERSSIGPAKGKHVSLIGRNRMMETDKFLLLQFALRDYAHEPYEKSRAGGDGTYALNDSYAIFNKKNDKFSFLNQTEKGVLGFRENLMDGPPFWPTYVSYDNSLVMVIPAITLIQYAETHTVSPKLAEIVKNLKETDNPVVVIAK